ncbi:MAG: hypothetical protein C0475_05175 [Planctomyces sp.]|nr:hypothetical protein [Planctomyces sp.]
MAAGGGAGGGGDDGGLCSGDPQRAGARDRGRELHVLRVAQADLPGPAGGLPRGPQRGDRRAGAADGGARAGPGRAGAARVTAQGRAAACAAAGPTPEPAVTIRDLWFTYPGAEAPALQGVSLTVPAGERLGILGPNGGGKSTLLKIILGLLEPGDGSVRVLGGAAARARRAGRVGYVPQRPAVERLLPLSVRQMVALSASWRLWPWRGAAAARRAAAEALELVGAEGFAHKRVGELSGGQLQRAVIARAVATRPAILALDEPAVGIDPAGQERLARVLADVHARLRPTILVISHDLRAIAAGCDRVACLAGRLHLHASPSGLTPAVLAEVFQHDIAGVIPSATVSLGPPRAGATP